MHERLHRHRSPRFAPSESNTQGIPAGGKRDGNSHWQPSDLRKEWPQPAQQAVEVQREQGGKEEGQQEDQET
ncbi:MAG: hypothetical protein FJ279_14815 [Planctomycetes bacterium]|nr:hypothetical protein [Planctomycetota bacterium]